MDREVAQMAQRPPHARRPAFPGADASKKEDTNVARDTNPSLLQLGLTGVLGKPVFCPESLSGTLRGIW